MNNYPIRDEIMSMLGASDLALLMATLGLQMSSRESEKYLSPARDLPEYQDWIADRNAEECSVLLVGIDAAMLLDRIQTPLRFWSKYKHKEDNTLWPVARRHCGHGTRCGPEDRQLLQQHGRKDSENPYHYYKHVGLVAPVPGTLRYQRESWSKCGIPNETRSLS